MFGLCNRIRTMVSYSLLAETLKVPVWIYWQESTGFDHSQWLDLFAEGCTPWISKWITPEEYPRLKGLAQRVGDSSNGLGHGKVTEFVLQHQQSGVGPTPTATPNRRFIYQGCMHLGYSLTAEEQKVIIPDFYHRYNTRLQQLVPTLALQREISSITDTFQVAGPASAETGPRPHPRRPIGLHIRRGDAVLHHSISHHYLVSSLEAFLKHIEDEIQQDPAVWFYLATDCAETQALLLKRSDGWRFRHHPSKHFVKAVVGPKAGQRDAVIDLFCLSQCEKVIGTNWSSFSEMSALIGNRPFLVAR